MWIVPWDQDDQQIYRTASPHEPPPVSICLTQTMQLQTTRLPHS